MFNKYSLEIFYFHELKLFDTHFFIHILKYVSNLYKLYDINSEIKIYVRFVNCKIHVLV